MLDNFFINGYQIFNEPQLGSMINTTGLTWKKEHNHNYVQNATPLLEAGLTNIHYAIAKKYVEPCFSEYEMLGHKMWEGVDEYSTFYHNDLVEGPNMFFLLYFSDMDCLQEGAIYFKQNTGEEFKYYPKKYDLIAVNCSTQFQHKADKTKHERILTDYNFYVKGLTD